MTTIRAITFMMVGLFALQTLAKEPVRRASRKDTMTWNNFQWLAASERLAYWKGLQSTQIEFEAKFHMARMNPGAARKALPRGRWSTVLELFSTRAIAEKQIYWPVGGRNVIPVGNEYPSDSYPCDLGGGVTGFSCGPVFTNSCAPRVAPIEQAIACQGSSGDRLPDQKTFQSYNVVSSQQMDAACDERSFARSACASTQEALAKLNHRALQVSDARVEGAKKGISVFTGQKSTAQGMDRPGSSFAKGREPSNVDDGNGGLSLGGFANPNWGFTGSGAGGIGSRGSVPVSNADGSSYSSGGGYAGGGFDGGMNGGMGGMPAYGFDSGYDGEGEGGAGGTAINGTIRNPSEGGKPGDAKQVADGGKKEDPKKDPKKDETKKDDKKETIEPESGRACVAATSNAKYWPEGSMLTDKEGNVSKFPKAEDKKLRLTKKSFENTDTELKAEFVEGKNGKVLNTITKEKDSNRITRIVRDQGDLKKGGSRNYTELDRSNGNCSIKFAFTAKMNEKGEYIISNFYSPALCTDASSPLKPTKAGELNKDQQAYVTKLNENMLSYKGEAAKALGVDAKLVKFEGEDIDKATGLPKLLGLSDNRCRQIAKDIGKKAEKPTLIAGPTQPGKAIVEKK